MIKRILVALDPDSDTPVAIRYAGDVASRYDAEVSGLAVVDLEHIQAGIRGGGIGSMYYAEKLRENLTEETRARAKELIDKFERALDGTGIAHSNFVEEGVPFRRIVEDLKYYDLLVVGKDPHFFYGDPKKETESLVHIVKEAVAPALIVGSDYHTVRRVLIAYDGSDAAARTLHAFVLMKPFGTDLEVELLHIYEKEGADADLLLRLAKEFLSAHGFEAQTTSLSGGDPARQITERAKSSNADLIVAGAHAVSKFRKMAFGSTTESLIKHSPRPLFVYH